MASIVNTSSEVPAGHTVDLSRLNDAERGVLRLLAEGHTAKSIANSLGWSPAAVNERLREARRKTGVGSSRELARVLRTQENRDEQFGIAKPAAVTATPDQPDAKARSLSTGVFVMIAIFGAAAVAMLMTGQTPVPEPASQTITDPELGAFTPVGPVWLYRTIRQEPSDISWAAEAEQTLKERYKTVQFFGQRPHVLRVMCRRMTCEVAASIAQPKLGSSYGVEEKSITEDMREKGLVGSGAAITGDTKSNRMIYLAYFLRTKR